LQLPFWFMPKYMIDLF